MRGRELRAGMANKKGDDVWKKNKSPWRAKLRPTDKDTRPGRKKEEEEELSDNIRCLRLAPAAFVPLMFPVRGLKSGFRSAGALWRPDFSPSGRRPEVKWTERSEV